MFHPVPLFVEFNCDYRYRYVYIIYNPRKTTVDCKDQLTLVSDNTRMSRDDQLPMYYITTSRIDFTLKHRGSYRQVCSPPVQNLQPRAHSIFRRSPNSMLTQFKLTIRILKIHLKPAHKGSNQTCQFCFGKPGSNTTPRPM